MKTIQLQLLYIKGHIETDSPQAVQAGFLVIRFGTLRAMSQARASSCVIIFSTAIKYMQLKRLTSILNKYAIRTDGLGWDPKSSMDTGRYL